MIKKTLLPLMFVLTVGSLFGQRLSADEAAIQKVIEDETHYFNQRDFDSWASHWVQQPYIYWSYIGPTTYQERKGWDALEAAVKADFDKYPDPVVDFQKKIDYEFKIEGKMAFITFLEDDNWSVRVLEKHKGKWKLIRMGVVQSSAFKDMLQAQKLEAFSGHWRVDKSSIKVSPEDANRQLVDVSHDVVVTGGGIDMVSWHSWKDAAGDLTKVNEKITFAYDSETDQTAVIHISSGTGWAKVATGNCEISDSGDLSTNVGQVGNSKSQIAHEFKWLGDDRYRVKYQFYSNTGDPTWNMTFDLRRVEP